MRNTILQGYPKGLLFCGWISVWDPNCYYLTHFQNKILGNAFSFSK